MPQLMELIRGKCYKTFNCHKLGIFVISQSVCSWQAFPAWSIVRKYCTILDRLARDEYFGLLPKFVTYGRKKFNIAHLGTIRPIAFGCPWLFKLCTDFSSQECSISNFELHNTSQFVTIHTEMEKHIDPILKLFFEQIKKF